MKAKRQHGFTLLEIMVVVLLIALTVGLVGLNLGRDVDQVAELEARRFAKLLEHLRDESILTGKVYAIEVDEQNKSYSFLEPADNWSPVVKDDVLRPRRIPEYLSIRFDLLQQPAKTNSRRLLVVQGMGDITPFQLVVTGDNYLYLVTLDDSLNVQVTQTIKIKLEHGFTLLEILAALAIAVIGITAVVKTTGSAVNILQSSEDRVLSSWVASNRLAELRLSRKWPAAVTSDQSAILGGRVWYYREEISTTDDPDLLRVDLSVFGDKDHAALTTKMFGYLSRYSPPSAPPPVESEERAENETAETNEELGPEASGEGEQQEDEAADQ